MDLHSTDELLGVVRRLIQPQTFLTRTFFSTVRRSESKRVHIDVQKGKRRLAPFVHPRSQGKIVETIGYETNTIEPAYIKPKAVFDPEEAIDHRTLGEALTGSLSPQQREDAWVAKTLMDHQEMIDRRLEWMASQILRLGQVTISGDGFDDILVDFLRDAALTKTLAGAARWGEAGVEPLDDLAGWSLEVIQKSGAAPFDVIMDPEAFNLFADSAKVERLLDTQRGSTARLESAPANRAEPELRGTIGNTRYWVYQDWYEDPATGLEVPLLPANTVIMASPAVEGRQHYGAIRDPKAGYRALPFFPKMWVEEDPAETYLLSQSAPILAPWRPDATVAVTVR